MRVNGALVAFVADALDDIEQIEPGIDATGMDISAASMSNSEGVRSTELVCYRYRRAYLGRE